MCSRAAPVLTGLRTCCLEAMPPPGLCPFAIAHLLLLLTSLPGGSRLPFLEIKNAPDDFLHHPGSVFGEITVGFTRAPQQLRSDLTIEIAALDENAVLPSGVVEAVVTARSLRSEVGPQTTNPALD